MLRNRNGRSGPGSQGRLSQEQSCAALSPRLEILDARDHSEHSREFAFSNRDVFAQLFLVQPRGNATWMVDKNEEQEERGRMG